VIVGKEGILSVEPPPSVGLEGKVEDEHSGEVEILPQLLHLRGNNPEVLRNNGELSQLAA